MINKFLYIYTFKYETDVCLRDKLQTIFSLTLSNARKFICNLKNSSNTFLISYTGVISSSPQVFKLYSISDSINAIFNKFSKHFRHWSVSNDGFIYCNKSLSFKLLKTSVTYYFMLFASFK